MDFIRKMLPNIRGDFLKKHYHSETKHNNSESIVDTFNLNNEVAITLNTKLNIENIRPSNVMDSENITNGMKEGDTVQTVKNNDLSPILTEESNKIQDLGSVDITLDDSIVDIDCELDNSDLHKENITEITGNSELGITSIENTIHIAKSLEVNDDISIIEPKIGGNIEISLEIHNLGINSDSEKVVNDNRNVHAANEKVESKNVETGDKNSIGMKEISDTIIKIDKSDENIQEFIDFEEVLQHFLISATPIENSEKIIDIDQYFDGIDGVSDIIESSNSINGNNDIKNEVPEEINAKLNENNDKELDIISISSTESKIYFVPIIIDDSQDSSDDGYNSSDFEFITEEEATKDGYIINFNITDAKINYFDNNDSVNNDENDKFYEAGPSGIQNVDEDSCLPFLDSSFNENHVIPIGDEYLSLFQGLHDPILSDEIRFWENKSIHSSAMNWQYDGIGFDRQLAVLRHDIDTSEDEFADEAKESAKKILNMYSTENRKRRRRR